MKPLQQKCPQIPWQSTPQNMESCLQSPSASNDYMKKGSSHILDHCALDQKKKKPKKTKELSVLRYVLAMDNRGFSCDASCKQSAHQCRRHKRDEFDTRVGKIALEEVTAIHSSIPAWRIPWTGKPGRLQSIELQRVRHD